MAEKYHIKDDGTPGRCSAATVDSCPRTKSGDAFHGILEEATRESEHRFAGSYGETATVVPESPSDVWPPANLPVELYTLATAADLIRHETDYQWQGGAGVCAGVSAYLSYILQNLNIDHSLANGVYTDDQGEHPHWWVETNSGWIIDGSRGQFDHGDDYRSGIVGRFDRAYSRRASWEPTHTSIGLVEAELKQAFGNPDEALVYLDLCEGLWAEAQRLKVEEH